MKKIKIVHIQVLPILSGVQKAMLDVLSRLDPDSYDFFVICNSEGKLTQELSKQKIPYIILPELRREINPYFDLLAFVKLFRLFKQEKYDVVHTHSSKPGILGRFAAKAAGIKHIVHTVQGFAFHEHSAKWHLLFFGFLEKLAGYATEKVIFVNQKDKKLALRLKLISREKIVLIRNGVDISYFENKNGKFDKSTLPDVGAQDRLVCMVARLWEQKAPEYFVKAVPLILDKFPRTKFLVIGDGPLKAALLKLTKSLQVDRSVRFLGWRSDVNQILRVIDVFVLPSLWEGLPLSILEAMAASKPVVASDIKGNNELVEHGETGFLFPPRNHQQMSDYVAKLLGDPGLAQMMGFNGYKRVKQRYDINKIAEKIDYLYKSFFSDNHFQGTLIKKSQQMKQFHLNT